MRGPWGDETPPAVSYFYSPDRKGEHPKAHLADFSGTFRTCPAARALVLRLGTGCLAAMPLPRIAQPFLDLLSEEIGQSTSVSILDETEIVYIARAAQRRVILKTLMPGSRLPAYCTSMGRVLLAAAGEETTLRLLRASQLIARTEYTVTNVDTLLAEIAK
ncbi:hypothetical protein ATY30_13990 [Sinorhizobium americanum]|uniref:IclR-ED domain-containing protein n=1 Tax=Sinorhizobium americanum TaxID=194963 RepID=A0A2S3YNH4_9HYPH|nr:MULTISPECIES: IclR family transcriptional regulator C-terminal domain-containing protein [Sinorhizobium]POH29894.1 hypothetical protein ATY30_13990 [Sinorhizobium americanum]POH30612.1 hypothetical protein ATY31_14385 [Sinorhizobium americanum]